MVQFKSGFSTAFAKAVGMVVLEASHAEDTLGELLVLRRGYQARDLDWWKSGEQLLSALKSLGDEELAPILNKMEILQPKRNLLVHGLFMEMKPGEAMIMKRNKQTKKSSKDNTFSLTVCVTPEDLYVLANEYRILEAMASDAVSDAMGIERSEVSGLPQRKVPLK